MSFTGFADAIIGDFEGSMSSWSLLNTGLAKFDTFGATLNDKSLALRRSATGAEWVLRHDGLIDLDETPILKLDVSWKDDENQWGVDGEPYPTPGHYARLTEIAVNTGGVAGQMLFTCTDLQNPSNPGLWDPYLWDDNTRQLIWDLSEYDMTGVFEAGWMQISFSVDSDIDSGNWYIDNIRLENPEPAAVALLGLGSLVLLLRRR
jgi:hypothetical protein